jgi:hypothetical protein
MANSSKASVQSKRTPMGKSVTCVSGGMLDHLAGVDTRYPDLHSERRLPGNGPAPQNPFSGNLPHFNQPSEK